MLALIRYELARYFYSPLGWTIWTVFLAVQGASFYLLASLTLGADGPQVSLVRLFFGGTALFWVLFILIISLITMRLIAEDRQLNTIDLLLTAPLTPTSLILGKFLAAVVFFSLLWLPVLGYLLVFVSGSLGGHFAAKLSIWVAYLGVLSVGTACIAVGVLFSTWAYSQIAAGLATFCALITLLVMDPVARLANHPALKAVATRLNIFSQMDDFSKSTIDTRHIVVLISIVSFSLIAAIVRVRRWNAGGKITNDIFGLCLVATLIVTINILAARHAYRFDINTDGNSSISERSRTLIRGLNKQLEITLFGVPPEYAEGGLYTLTKEFLERLSLTSDRIRTKYIDIDIDTLETQAMIQRHAIDPTTLRDGVVIVSSGDRSRALPVGDFAAPLNISKQEKGVVGFDAEAQIMGAARAVMSDREDRICFSQDHGEPKIDSHISRGYGRIAAALRRDGFSVSAIRFPEAAATLTRCDVVIVGGVTRSFQAADISALDDYLVQGGRLFVLLGPILDGQVRNYGEISIESFLMRWGIALKQNIIVDPHSALGEQKLLTWVVSDSDYGPHRIGRAMSGRPTLWPLAREVRLVENPALKIDRSESGIIASSSPKGWAESSLPALRGDEPLSFSAENDTPGPVPVAVALRRKNTSLVVFGSERGVLNRRLVKKTGGYHNQDLFLASVAWLVDHRSRIDILAKPISDHHIVFDERDLDRIFLLSFVIPPLLTLCIGLWIRWRRRF